MRHHIQKTFRLFLILFFFISTITAEPNHPELEWFSFESEHFIYHYHAGTEQTARMVLRVAEEMYPYVTSVYDFEPATKTQVIIMDTDDYANGGAYYFENKILLWASPLQFDLRGNHNWIRNVFTHEFSHIVSLGKAMKYPISIPAAFVQVLDREKPYKDNIILEYPKGIGAAPISNVVVPMWWAEGVAQYQFESSQADYWDSHRDMLLRDRALNGSLLTWQEAAYFDKKGTGNESVYNTGYAFVHYLSDVYGFESQKRIAEIASSVKHWSFDKVFKKVFNRSGRDLYREWTDKLTADYLIDTELIRKNMVKGEIIRDQGPAYVNVSVSPDGEKVVMASAEGRDYIGQTYLCILTEDGKTELLDKNSRIRGNVAWSPDSRSIYYVKQRHPNLYGSVYFDLARYDFENKKSEFITKNARIYSATVSSTGELYVIYVHDGSHNIARVDENGKLYPLTDFRHGEQVYTISVSPAGETLIFDMALTYGRDIYELDIERGTVRGLIHNVSYDNRHPSFSSDGKSVIYASDRTGIFNIYSRDLTSGEDILITNITGAAFYPAQAPNGSIFYTLFENGLFKLAKIATPQPVDPALAEYRPYRVPDSNYDPKYIPPIQPAEYTSQFSRIFFIPFVMIDYNKPKFGFEAFQNEVLNKYNLYTSVGISTSRDMDAYGRLDFNFFLPSLYLEGYYVTYNLNSTSDRLYDFYEFERDISFKMWEATGGIEYNWLNHNWHLSLTRNQYSAQISDYDKNTSTQFKPFGYTYNKGTSISGNWIMDFILRDWHSDINPRRGFTTKLTAAYDFNQYLQDFGINEEFNTLQEIYSNENTLRLELDSELFIPVSIFKRSALSFAVNSGWQENAHIDSFFHYYGGGRHGLKGYPFYAVEGTQKVIFTGMFRFPVIPEMNLSLEPFFFNRLYAGVYYQAGDAWRGPLKEISWKQNIGLEIRLGGQSFYAYPLAITFDAVYGFDSFTRWNETTLENVSFGKEWRFYWSVLFNFPNRTDPL